MNTLQRSLPTAAFGATAKRKVDPTNGRKVMVATSRGEVIGVSFINLKVQVGGKGVTYDGQFKGPFVGVVDAGRKAKRSNGYLETPLLAARNLGVAHQVDRMKYLFYVPQTWIKSGKGPPVAIASSSGSQSSWSTVYWDEKSSGSKSAYTSKSAYMSKSAKLNTRKRLSPAHNLRRSKSAKQLTVVDKNLAVVEPAPVSDAAQLPRSASEVQPSRSWHKTPRRASEAPPLTLDKDAPCASPAQNLSEAPSRRASEEALDFQISTSTTSTASFGEVEVSNLAETVPPPVKIPKRKAEVKSPAPVPTPAKVSRKKSDVTGKQRPPKSTGSAESSPETYARSVPNVMRTGSLVPPLHLDAIVADSASIASNDHLSQDEDDEYAVQYDGRGISARVAADKKHTSKRMTEGSKKERTKSESSHYADPTDSSVKPFTSARNSVPESVPEIAEKKSVKKQASRRHREVGTEKLKGKKGSSKRDASDSKSRKKPSADSRDYDSHATTEQVGYHSKSRTEKGSDNAMTSMGRGSYDALSQSEKGLYASLFENVGADDMSKSTSKRKAEKEEYLPQSLADKADPPSDEVAQDLAMLMAGSLSGETLPMPVGGLMATGVVGEKRAKKKSSPEKAPQSNAGDETETILSLPPTKPVSKTSSRRSSRMSSRSSSKSQSNQSSKLSLRAPLSSSSKAQKAEKQAFRQMTIENALAEAGAEKKTSTDGIETEKTEAEKTEAEQLDQEILKLSRLVETVRGGKFRSSKKRLSKVAAAQSARVQDQNRSEMEDMALEVIEEEDAAAAVGRRFDRPREIVSAGPGKAGGAAGVARGAGIHEVGKVHAWNAEKKSVKSVLKPQSIVTPATSQSGQDQVGMRRVSSTDLFTTVVGLSSIMSSRSAEAARALNADSGSYHGPDL